MNGLDLVFFCTVIKDGLQTKVTCFALPSSLVQDMTKKKRKLQQTAGEKEKDKYSSSFSPLRSRSV